MLLLIDSGDAFTYSLQHVLCDLGAQVEVRRGADLSPEAVAALAPERIVLSSGPGAPTGDGLLAQVIRRYGESVPILGLGLGHLAIACAFGGGVGPARRVGEGWAVRVYHQGKGVLAGLPSPFEAAAYHSLAVERDSLPADLEITAQTTTGLVMALRHRAWPVEGLQFNPESHLTPRGRELLQTFLAYNSR